MKRFLLLFLLLPVLCHAQENFAGKLAEERYDDYTHDTVRRSYWQVLERSSPRNHLTTLFRISAIGGAYYVDLKVRERNDQPFVIARNAELKLKLENGEILTLYNLQYAHTCPGCGSWDITKSSALGVLLSFRIYPDELRKLQYSYIDQLRLFRADRFFQCVVSGEHSEMFMDELKLVLDANRYRIDQ